MEELFNKSLPRYGKQPGCGGVVLIEARINE